MLVSDKLAGPIAFGALRPGVGLPADFWTAHSRAEQDAMLIHELAPHAARDPLWLALADLLLTALWWHPLVWWARRQFRDASEAAADEASLVVEDGPTVLAGCLVTLAARLQRRGVLGLLGMAGFRSGLGRRVERLLRLRAGESPVAAGRGQGVFVAAAGVMSLGVGVAITGWLVPAQAAARPALLAVMGEALNRVSAPEVEPSGETKAESTAGESAVDSSVLPKATSEVAPAPNPNTKAASPHGQTSDLIQDAKRLFELGHITEARAKLEAALRLEPDNQAARNNLKRVNEAEITKTLPRGDAKAEPPQLLTRTFKVEPRTLAAGLESIAGKGLTNLTAAEQLRWLFVSAGLEFTSTNAAPADGPPARALFYNDRNGLMLVRATAAELQTVEQLLQVLNTTGPQVTIEAKFVEVTESASRALGFDWFLGSARMSANAADIASPPGSTGGVATLSGLMTDPQFREAVAALRQGGTNGGRELRGDQLDWPGRNAANAGNIRVTAALGPGLTGILTEAQYRALLRALEQREGVDVLSAPRVTTLSGRQAQIQMADMQNVLNGINPQALVRPGVPSPAAGTAPFLTSTVPTGPTLDILPTVAADGYTLEPGL